MQDDDDDFDPTTWPELTDEEQAQEDEERIDSMIWWWQTQPDGPELFRDLERPQQWELVCELDSAVREFEELRGERAHFDSWLKRRKTWGRPLGQVRRACEAVLASAEALDLAARELAASDKAHHRFSEELARRSREVRRLLEPISVQPLREIRTNPKLKEHRKLLAKYRLKFMTLFISFKLSDNDAIARTHKIGERYWDDANVTEEAYRKVLRQSRAAK